MTKNQSPVLKSKILRPAYAEGSWVLPGLSTKGRPQRTLSVEVLIWEPDSGAEGSVLALAFKIKICGILEWANGNTKLAGQ